MSRHIVILAAAAVLAGTACKKSNNEVTLKGLTAGETQKEINYPALIQDGRTLTFENVVSYESSYHVPAGSNAASDQGTVAAYTFLNWLATSAKTGLFNGNLVVESNTFPDQSQTRTDQTYRLSALAKGMRLTYSYHGQQLSATVDIRVVEVLGAALGPDDAHTMPDDFRSALADAFVTADVASYDGHIWVANIPDDPRQQVAVDDNTQALTDAMRSLGGRTKYGILYMNACNGETIEQAMMSALLGGDPTHVEPILISHRNESNFGFFADHDAFLLMDVMNGNPLQELMLHFTSTLGHPELAVDPRDPFSRTRPQAGGSYNPANAGVPTNPNVTMTADAAAKALADYYTATNAYSDPLQVMVVAYDMSGGKLRPDNTSSSPDSSVQ